MNAGITRGYRAARNATQALDQDSDAAQFHAWRRRVKDHAYQVRLFETWHPSARARARDVGALAEWLGHHQNQAVLRHVILESPDRFGDARTTAVVLGCITRLQASERQRALRIGRRLSSLSATRFRRSVTAWGQGRRKK